MKRLAWILGPIAALVFALYVLRTPPSALHGLWIEHEVHELSDELRFYYFHPGGKGLYRYGQVGYNKTNSFDWSLDGDRLSLVFRKTGERASTRIRIEEADGRRTLTLVADPRGEGVGRYQQRRGALEADAEPALLGPLEMKPPGAPEASGALAGRIWMSLQRYATGGQGFTMYQLSEHRLPSGLHLGWHHVGDFDDWSTETLGYAEQPGSLRLRFLLRDEEAVSPVSLEQRRDERVLTLGRDPRNFLQRTRLRDAGKSF